MAKFEDAIVNTLKWEDPSGRGKVTSDTGGETRWGISQKAYPDLDIANLSLESAKDIYRHDYWNPLYDQIASQNVASKLFDMGVNMGIKTAVKLCQKALAGCGELVSQDGKFGLITLAAINRCDSQNLLTELRAESCEYYRGLANAKPEKYSKYLAGWLRRARS